MISTPSPIDSRREAFIVRVWFMTKVNTWVAEVRDVHTGQVYHLRSLEDLPGKMRQFMTAPDQPVSSLGPEEDENTA